jgi:hypothetical protein
MEQSAAGVAFAFAGGPQRARKLGGRMNCSKGTAASWWPPRAFRRGCDNKTNNAAQLGMVCASVCRFMWKHFQGEKRRKKIRLNGIIGHEAGAEKFSHTCASPHYLLSVVQWSFGRAFHLSVSTQHQLFNVCFSPSASVGQRNSVHSSPRQREREASEILLFRGRMRA